MRQVSNAKTIGIAQTLIHYIDALDWKGFFQHLGLTVITSGKSSAELFHKGFKYAVNDDCFPMKMFYGHVLDLKDRVDCLFIPQLVSLMEGMYNCPKIIGLPLLIKNTVPDLPEFHFCSIDMHDMKLSRKEVLALCKCFSSDKKRIKRAMEHFDMRCQELTASSHTPKRYTYQDEVPVKKKKIGIIGHNYALNDPMLNMRIGDKIKEYGFSFETSDLVDTSLYSAKSETPFGYEKLHWEFGKQIAEVAEIYRTSPDIAGVIYLTYFGCGADSFIEELFKDRVREDKPYLSLSIDEHSGEAGLLTRIEAFLDMIELTEKRTA